MRKNSLFVSLLCEMTSRRSRSVMGVLAAFALVLCLGSCAKGEDCDEVYSSTVSNAQLESPEISFSRVFNSDGTQSVKVSWDVVLGASGYECHAEDITDGGSEVVYDGVVDGTSFLFARERDRLYSVSVKALGNTDRNNKDALEAKVGTLSTAVQPITIESTDFATEINSIMSQYGDPEYIFLLKSGVTYTLDDNLDFGESMVTLQGEETNSTVTRPIVKVVGDKGYISTYSTLTIENINFDCTSNNRKGGVVEMTANPPESVAGTNTYYSQSPIIIQSCMFKNVHCCLFALGNSSWGVEDVRVIDCIVQLDNDGSIWSDGSIISGYSTNNMFKGDKSGYSAIRYTTVSKSTLYNIKDSSKNFRFIRFTNADLSKPFGGTTYGGVTISDCTLSKTFVSKEFANNIGKAKDFVISFSNTNFYEVFRIWKIKNGSNVLDINPSTNAVSYGTLLSTDNSNASYATNEDFSFAGDNTQVLDFTKENGGVNFKANGTLSKTIGDPRWK